MSAREERGGEIMSWLERRGVGRRIVRRYTVGVSLCEAGVTMFG